MSYRTKSSWILLLGLLAACDTGVRELDFVSKQFSATYNIDSTRGLDSTTLAKLMASKAVYNFGEDGKGVNHVQMGMVSKDTPFRWKVEKDSLLIDNQAYAVQRQEKGFILKSDSTKIMLSKQP